MMGAGPYFVTSVSREFTPGAGSSRQLPTEGMRPWRVMRRLSLAIAAALACAAPPPGAPGWRILGPGGGGSLFHPTVSPHDSRTALVACDMTGSYLTHDGGATWRIFNLGETVQSFLFDPDRKSTRLNSSHLGIS